MDTSKIIKLVVVIIILVVGGPIILRFMPSPLTMERIVDGLKKSDLGINDIRDVTPPTCESIAQIQFALDGVIGNVYQYDNEGTIARYAEMYKKDPGTAIVEAWGLAQSLGAAPSKNKPERVARRKMFLLVVQGEDTALLDRIVKLFLAI